MSSMLGVTFLAVSKVIVSVLIGAITCNSIPNTSSTLRDFSFLISNVLLPSLTLANTARSVDAEVLIRCSILIVFSFITIGLGIFCGAVLNKTLFRLKRTSSGIPLELKDDVRLVLQYEQPNLTPAQRREAIKQKKKIQGTPYVAVVLSDKLRDMGVDGHEVVPSLEVPGVETEEFPGYSWGSWVACSIQNNVTLPLSVLQNLAVSLPWIDFVQGTAYIFVFSMAGTMFLWAAGPYFVERAQRETIQQHLIRQLIVKHKKLQNRCDAATQTEVAAVGSPVKHSTGHLPPVAHDEHAEPTMEVSGMDVMATLPSVTVGMEVVTPSSPPEMVADSGVQTEMNMSPTTMRRVFPSTEAMVEQIPYNWETAGLIRVKYAGEMREEKKSDTWKKFVHSSKQLGWRLFTNLPFMSIVLGIIIGVIPPIRGLFFDGGVLEMLMDAISLVAQGSIPCSLLLLGANLVGSTAEAVGGSDDVRMRDSEQNTEFLLTQEDWEVLGVENPDIDGYNAAHEHVEFDIHASFSLQSMLQQRAQAYNRQVAAPQRVTEAGATGTTTTTTTGSGADHAPSAVAAASRSVAPQVDMAEDEAPKEKTVMDEVRSALSLSGVKPKFVWGIIGVRLGFAPAFSYVVLLFLIKTMPFLFGGRGTEDKTLLVVLFAEMAAPTAINSALLYNAREFMTYPWAKMLFFQYILCTITQVVWMSLALVIAESV